MASVFAATNFAALKAAYERPSLRWIMQPKKQLAFSSRRTNLHSNASHEVEGSPWDHKGLLQSEELYECLPAPLKEIRSITENHPDFFMGATPDSGQLIAMLLNLLNAKNTIEIGVFTGYSLLLTALTIPDDGKILAIDPNRHSYEIGLPIIQKAGVEHKIDFKNSPALPVVDKLLEDDKNRGSFDFAFVDADKINYGNYHERLMQLVKIGVDESMRLDRSYFLEFHRFLAADTRIQISQVPLGDGMIICRRLNKYTS